MAAPAGLSNGPAPEPVDTQTADPDPVATEPGAADLQAAEPEAADPGAGKPRPAEPVATELEPADATKLEAAGAADAEPIDAEPAAAGPEAAEPTGQAHEESMPAVVDPDPGLAEHADEVRRVSPLAVAAGIVGIIALVGVAVAVLAVVTHGFRPKTIVTYRTAAVFSLRPGDCINSSPNGLSSTVRSCATPHDAEVFATFRLTGSSWPGSAVVHQEAGTGCMSRLAGYLNPAFANVGFAEEYIYPDQEAWQAGERTVVCEVRASSGQLTGSVGQGG